LGSLLESFSGSSELEVLFPIGNGEKFLIGCYDVFVWVGDCDLPCGLFLCFDWKVTWTMVVKVGNEVINVELVDETCLISGDMPMTKFPADDSSVLALNKSVVCTGTGTTLCLIDTEFL